MPIFSLTNVPHIWAGVPCDESVFRCRTGNTATSTVSGFLTKSLGNDCAFRGRCHRLPETTAEMGLLANFKIRTKVLIALLPLAIMVIIAVLYSSDRMSTIDARYSGLLENDVKALQNLTLVQAHNNKFTLFLYKEIAELDPGRMRVIDGDIDQTVTDFHATIDEAKRDSPDVTSDLNAAAALFDQEVADSRPVRAATQAQQNDKAMKLMREVYDPQWSVTRRAVMGLQQAVRSRVDQQSVELTASTIRTIRTTWVV